MYIRIFVLSICLSTVSLFGQISQYPAVGGAATQYISPGTYGSSLVADLANASSKVIRIAVFGDSLSRCTVSNCSVNASFPADGNVWPSLLRTYLNGKYTSHGTGIIPIRSQVEPAGSSEADAVYFASETGNFDACNVGFQQVTPGIAGYQCYQMGTTVNATTTLTSKAMTFDKIGFYYLTNFSLTGAGFGVNIDGSSVGTFGTENTGCCVGHNVYVSAPGGLGSHTFSASNTGTGITFMYYVDASIGSVGVSVDNVAAGAAKSEFFSAVSTDNSVAANGPANTTNLLFTKWSVDDTWFMVMLSTNDYLNVASNRTDWYLNGLLSDLITTHGVNPGKILLILPPACSPQNAGQSGANDQSWFNKKVEQIAATWGAAFLNVGNYDPRFLSFQTQSDAGFMLTDGTHMNTAGQSAFFTAIKSALGLQ